MERAIKKAIDGGWRHKNVETEDEEPAMIRFVVSNPHKTLLDPLFWQALGKAEGWEKYEAGRPFYVGADRSRNYPEWKREWHLLIDHLARGGSIDEYFIKILKQ